ncbi:MAG: PAS domain-containing sensor histidine kinase [Deltaproteobacteria bacterium]|nr:PAS domain-containing sensor histidine kinase [Deltaproteobacteria bacterium]
MVKNRNIGWLNLALLIIGATSGAMGLVVLVGSYTQSVRLIELLQAFAPMQYNAALGFILCGTGLLAIAFQRLQVGLVAGAAAAIGLFVLYFGVDQSSAYLPADEAVLAQTPLAVGLVMALLLAVAVHFAQIAWLRAREAEAVNRELNRQISERRQVEEALRASQDYARNIIDSSLDMIIAVDSDRRIVEFNKAAQESFGYRPEEVLGKHINMLYADASAGLKVHKRTIEKTRDVLEVLNQRKNGEIFASHLSAAVLKDGRGEQIGVMGISRDISEHKRAEEAARRNLQRIRTLEEIEKAVASTLDLPTVLEVLLEKAARLLPYSAAGVWLASLETGNLESVACRDFDQVEWKGRQWKAGHDIPELVFQTKGPIAIGNLQADEVTDDYEFYRRHGLVSYLGIPLVAKGEMLGVLGFYTRTRHLFGSEEIAFLMTVAGQAAIAIQNSQLYDEMKNLAGELAKSNRVKDEFLSVMSHELRTPLNVVMGYTGMVRDGMFGEINAEQQRALEKVISRAKDQLTMISSILEATRMEVEKVAVETQEFDLGKFLEDLRSSYEIPMEKPTTLHWDYPSDMPVVKTDKGKLDHILHNLINNAIKFTDNGSVTVYAWYYPLAKSVEFKIVDTGIGIPKDSREVIFEIFRQVDSSETRAHGGVGIGLYIVKKFTELLKGKIHVESEPGKGSTFTVKFPVEVHSLLRGQQAA